MVRYWFDHLHFVSHDPQKTMDFFKEKFGAKEVEVRSHADGRLLAEFCIEGLTFRVSHPLTEAEAAEKEFGYKPGLDHFGVGTDDIEKAAAELKAEGVDFITPPTQLRPGLKLCFIKAPEGVTVEIQEKSKIA